MKHTCKCGLAAIAALLAGAAMAHGDGGGDWRDIAQHLVDRRANTNEGVVDYRLYGFQIDEITFNDLASILLAAQATPNPNVIADVEAWLQAHRPEEVGAMRGFCTYDGPLWQDSKQVTREDTLYEASIARALDSGAVAVERPRQVRTHSDGTTETTVEENRVVHFRNAPDNVHVMSPLDMSLFHWQTAIDEGPAPGQIMFAEVSGSVHSILLTSEDPNDPVYAEMSHDFDAALDWAPLRATLRVAGVVQIDHIFAYADDGGDAPARPAVVLRGTRKADGTVQSSLWVVESWQEWSDPQWLILRLPPYRLVLDYRSDPHPPLEIQRPDYLTDKPANEWVSITLRQILDASSGGYDPQLDFDCNGEIDDDDAQAALAVLARKPER